MEKVLILGKSAYLDFLFKISEKNFSDLKNVSCLVGFLFAKLEKNFPDFQISQNKHIFVRLRRVCLL